MKRSDTTLTVIPTTGRKARYRFIEWRKDGLSFFAEKDGRPYIFTLTPPRPPWSEKIITTTEAQAPYPSDAPLEIRQCSLDPAPVMTDQEREELRHLLTGLRIIDRPETNYEDAAAAVTMPEEHDPHDVDAEAERGKWRDEYRQFLNHWLEVSISAVDFGSPKTAFPIITEKGRKTTVFTRITVDETKPLLACSEFTRPNTPAFMAACAVVKWRVTFAGQPPAFASELDRRPVGKRLSEEYEQAAAAVKRAADPGRPPADRKRQQDFAKLYTAISQGSRVNFRDLSREQREAFNNIGVTTHAEYTRLRGLAKKAGLIKGSVYTKRTKQQR
jgi:hypothetical protein